MKATWKSELPSLVCLALMFVLVALTWSSAPDSIPVHWNLRGDIDRYGEILHEHWTEKRKVASKMTDATIDEHYDAARRAGAIGGKLMGAGGGGFFMFLCPNSHKLQLREAMDTQGLREMLFDFDYEGAKVLVNF